MLTFIIRQCTNTRGTHSLTLFHTRSCTFVDAIYAIYAILKQPNTFLFVFSGSAVQSDTEWKGWVALGLHLESVVVNGLSLLILRRQTHINYVAKFMWSALEPLHARIVLIELCFHLVDICKLNKQVRGERHRRLRHRMSTNLTLPSYGDFVANIRCFQCTSKADSNICLLADTLRFYQSPSDFICRIHSCKCRNRWPHFGHSPSTNIRIACAFNFEEHFENSSPASLSPSRVENRLIT